ncbi:MAG: sensor histidine kinase [Gemmatimonadales bacterium]
MRSLRATLTLWYTVALTAAVLAFGLMTTLLQQRTNERAQQDRLGALSGRVAAVLAERATDGHGALVNETFAPRLTSLRTDVQDQMRVIAGLVMVVGREGVGVYSSPELLRLSSAARDSLRLRLFTDLRATREPFTATLDRADFDFVAQRVQVAGPYTFVIAVGETALDPQAALGRLATSMLVVLPVSALLAAVVGWLLADRALRPVGRMIDELEEITDGRSLHRRLPGAPGGVADELGRLANALNSLLARLETSFASMRRFVADASHELKTPLTVMRAGVERALTDAQTSPEALEPLEDTLEGVRYMTELVDTLLTLARVDEGRMELHTEPVDLAPLLGEVYETGQILGEETGIEVVLEMPPEPVVVEADRARIRQLAMNLVTNAIKYTPARGKVWITLSGTADAATIAVRDTGIGIAPGDVGRVFDRFWRADQARSRTGERPGIGLGLAISKWIAEAHGGSIGVTSRPGRGSTFTVTLPRRLEAPRAVIES